MQALDNMVRTKKRLKHMVCWKLHKGTSKMASHGNYCHFLLSAVI